MSAARPLRVLVVEDSESDYELLLMLLAGANYALDAERVEDERAMQAALAKGGWDVVISDHRLPRFSAHAALATLNAYGADIPFLIVSGAIGEEVAVEAMRAGADDYLMKDNLGRLEPALDRAIEVAASRRHRRETEAALAESEERFPDQYARWLDFEQGWEDGESYEAMARRVVATLLKLAESHEGERFVAVTHGGPIRAALAFAGGTTYAEARRRGPSVANVFLAEFAVESGAFRRLD